MVSKVNNSDSFFRSTSGLSSETELTKAQGKSENSLITEFGMPALDVVDNSHKQARYKDQWSTENATKSSTPLIDVLVSQVKPRDGAHETSEQIKIPSKIEIPNLVFDEKK